MKPTQNAADGLDGPTFKTGKASPIHSALVTVSGQRTTLALGRKVTVVLAMATWCKYCAYMDKWVLPPIAKEPGVAVDVIDLSPMGGIADPGPRRPAFNGTDGSVGTFLSQRGMETAMRLYAAKYGIASSGIHFYVAPTSTRQQWHVTAFPTIIVLNAHRIVALQQARAMTLSQLSAAVDEVAGHQ